MTGPSNYDPTRPLCSGDVDDVIAALRANTYPWYYPSKAKGLAVGAFTYVANFLPLPASKVTQTTVQIDGDSAFLVTAMTAEERSVDDLTVFPNPAILVNLKNSGSGAYLSSDAQITRNWFGTAERPFILPVPLILSPNTGFICEGQNLEAVDRNFRVSFHGFKVYTYEPTTQNGQPALGGG